MRRNEEYLLREAAGLTLILPVGAAAARLNGMIQVNETGAFLWEQLAVPQTRESLAAALTDAYEVTREQAAADVDRFLSALASTEAILED